MPQPTTTTGPCTISESFDTFGAYMESEAREKVFLPAASEIAGLSTDPDGVYYGNRVYDEL